MKKIMPFKKVYQNITHRTRYFANSVVNQIFPPSSASILAKTIRPEDIFTLEPRAHIQTQERSSIPLGMQVLFSYKAPLIRSFLEELRHFKNSDVGHFFAHFLLKEIREMAQLQHILEPIVVFIPCTRERMKGHGFWQFHTIYMYMARICAKNHIYIAHPDTLIYTKVTKKSRAFQVQDTHRKSIADRYCILIDDIIISGNTMSSARDALFLGGATHISCLAIAR
jgi:predicted amidophosphoribosyltransferase